jgi:methylthioribose-1-phosphate isomerase
MAARPPQDPPESPEPLHPDEVSIFVDPDGSVTFCDLPAPLARVVQSLKGSPAMSEPFRPVALEDDAVVLLDQRRLPRDETYLTYRDADGVAGAIRDMVVRGAPAIGIAAAMGMAVAARRAPGDPDAFFAALDAAARTLVAARPTAVNLAWAVARVQALAVGLRGRPVPEIRDALAREARRILDEDIAMNRAIGAHGGALIPDGATVMTHCNAGALATGGYGTALGVIRGARDAGRAIRVIACETRPYLQGARLTAWELVHDGFDVTLITDNAAGHLMSRGRIDAIVVGADRIAANGDTANKIGTYTHAVLAARHGIPFYVAAPSSTLDPAIPDGTHIPIEERSADEVLMLGGTRVAAEGVHVVNPSFDVTPWSLITAIVTERGVHRPGPDGYGFDR